MILSSKRRMVIPNKEPLIGQECTFNGFPCRYNSFMNCLELKVEDSQMDDLLRKTENTKLPFYIKAINLVILKGGDKSKKVHEEKKREADSDEEEDEVDEVDEVDESYIEPNEEVRSFYIHISFYFITFEVTLFPHK